MIYYISKPRTKKEKIMKKYLYNLLLLLIVTTTITSCKKDNEDIISGNDSQTSSVLIMYLPWTGNASQTDRGLYRDFVNNKDELKAGIITEGGIAKGQKIMVFLSESPTVSKLYQLIYKDGIVEEHLVKTYGSNYSFNNPTGLSSLLSTIKRHTNATNTTKYGLIFGGHGVGWTTKEVWEEYPTRSHTTNKPTWAAPQFTLTRFMGSASDKNYAINIEEISSAIAGAGIKLQYLLFDDCYMANAETAYILKDVTNYLIASTSEIMAIGMPYKTMYKSLNPQNPSYTGVVASFKDFFDNYVYPYGALSVIDCSKITQLATQMKRLNSKYTINPTDITNVQKLGGFEPTIFFDILSYVNQLKPTHEELSNFQELLQNTVVASTNTPQVISLLYSGKAPNYITITEYCGMTISDPTTHPVALKKRQDTDWWAATH